jgi:hypothetical protein
MSVPIIHTFNNAIKQSYLYNTHVLKFIDNNDSQQIINEKLF